MFVRHSLALGLILGLTLTGWGREVLVLRSSLLVERFDVGADGAWKKLGTVVDGRKLGLAPVSLAVDRDGVLLVGDRSQGGRIVKFSPRGDVLGVLVKTKFAPYSLTFDADGKFLYCTDGREIFRYDVATGQGGALTKGGMRSPYGLAFGGDGMLYVTCTDEGCVAVLDVSGAQAKLLGKLEVQSAGKVLTFAGRDGSVLVLPAERPELVDLAAGKSTRLKADATLRNVTAAGWIGSDLYAIDHPSGDIYRIDLAQNRIDRVEGHAIYAEAIVDVAAARAGGVSFAWPKRAIAHELKSVRPDFVRLPCNNPESVVFLKGGFGTSDLRIVDWDGDGQLDILTTSGWDDWVWRGNYLFLNPTKAGEKNSDPVFPKAERLTDTALYIRFPNLNWRTFYGVDGRPLRPAHYTKVCYEQRQLLDFDGDGHDDLVITVADRKWDDWHDKYDDRGIWTAGHQLHGYVYVAKWASGAGDLARYAAPEIVRLENGHPLEVYGNPPTVIHDWDGDGDLDLILFDFMNDVTYFENIGTRTKPVYTSGRLLHDADGRLLGGELCLPTVTTADWDGDGHLDLFIGEEDARVGWFRNTGRLEKGLPVFERVKYFRQQADELNFGVLNTPAVFDWDGDGDEDILSGNSQGQIAFIENMSGPKVEQPKWAPPQLLTEPDGRPIRIVAGPNGSIQGPCESQWGYTVVSVADWDGDGLPDIMANSVRGEIRWWKNVGTRQKPKLDFAQGVEVEWDGDQPPLNWGWIKPETQKNPKWIVAPWRTTPVMHDFNGDGLVDLMLMDGDNNLAFYERAKSADGQLILKAPRKAFTDENGKPLWFPGSWGTVAGGAGRYKFAVADWDGDGKVDIIVNGGANAYLLRQIKAENGNWQYRYSGPLARLKLSTHDPAPAVCDFNGDGVPDLLMGPMDGYFYSLRNERKGNETQ